MNNNPFVCGRVEVSATSIACGDFSCVVRCVGSVWCDF